MDNRKLIRVAKSVRPLDRKYFVGKNAKREYLISATSFDHARAAILEGMGVPWKTIEKMSIYTRRP